MFQAPGSTPALKPAAIVVSSKLPPRDPLDADQGVGTDTRPTDDAGGQIGGDAGGRVRVSRKIDAQIANEDVVPGAAVQNIITVVAAKDVVPAPPMRVSLPAPPTRRSANRRRSKCHRPQGPG